MAISIPTSTGAGAQTAAGATAKAFLMVDPSFVARFPVGKPPIPALVCRYNPGQLTISGGGTWQEAEVTQQHDLAPATFQRPNPRTMSVELFFDQFELPSGDVSAEVEALFDWTRPRTSPLGQASAPWLRFQWGAKRWFKCYIESLNVTYTLFSRSGAPLRARASVTLKETFDPVPGTNPTSGGAGGERSHTIAAGDTLHSLAHRYYGRAALWRGLAACNGIDDPLRLATGTVVSIPEVAVVEELS